MGAPQFSEHDESVLCCPNCGGTQIVTKAISLDGPGLNQELDEFVKHRAKTQDHLKEVVVNLPLVVQVSIHFDCLTPDCEYSSSLMIMPEKEYLVIETETLTSS